MRAYKVAIIALWLVLSPIVGMSQSENYSDESICNAIYKAEGGSKTAHPYGILKHYKHTTPRQACLNTIAHCRRDWNGFGDFIDYLGSIYAPTKNCGNDPKGLNKNWVKNVRYFLLKEEKEEAKAREEALVK
jgi:hypothetical protein